MAAPAAPEHVNDVPDGVQLVLACPLAGTSPAANAATVKNERMRNFDVDIPLQRASPEQKPDCAALWQTLPTSGVVYHDLARIRSITRHSWKFCCQFARSPGAINLTYTFVIKNILKPGSIGDRLDRPARVKA